MKKFFAGLLALIMLFALCSCGKQEPAPQPVANNALPDLEAFASEYSAEQQAKAAEQAPVNADWVPAGNFTLTATGLIMYIRISNADINAGTAEVTVMQTDSPEANTQPVTETVKLNRTDFGGGNLEYSFTAGGRDFVISGTSSSKTAKAIINGQTYMMENKGIG